MVLRNDYQRGLYNGDQGIVISYAEDDDRAPRLAAAFPRVRAGRPGPSTASATRSSCRTR